MERQEKVKSGDVSGMKRREGGSELLGGGRTKGSCFIGTPGITREHYSLQGERESLTWKIDLHF